MAGGKDMRPFAGCHRNNGAFSVEPLCHSSTSRAAVRGGVPYAINFMDCAPDADLHSVGPENFAWVVNNMAEVLIELGEGGRPLELTGSWPAKMGR
jgi:hypothetical protein